MVNAILERLEREHDGFNFALRCTAMSRLSDAELSSVLNDPEDDDNGFGDDDD